MRPGSGVEARWFLDRATQCDYPGDGFVDALVRRHVDVCTVRLVLLDPVHDLKDQLVLPGVLASQIPEAAMPASFAPDHVETGDR